MRKSRRPAHVRIAVVASAVALVVGAAFAQTSTVDEIAKYRAALQDGNPAELWEARGEGLWKQPRGPNKVSLEKCDLGLGPAWSRARTRRCRAISPTPTASWTSRRASSGAWSSCRDSREADAKRNPFGAGRAQGGHGGARRLRHVANRAA